MNRALLTLVLSYSLLEISRWANGSIASPENLGTFRVCIRSQRYRQAEVGLRGEKGLTYAVFKQEPEYTPVLPWNLVAPGSVVCKKLASVSTETSLILAVGDPELGAATSGGMLEEIELTYPFEALIDCLQTDSGEIQCVNCSSPPTWLVERMLIDDKSAKLCSGFIG